MKGMPVGLKAGEKRLILMDTPRSSEQRRRERHRDRLKRDLDAQVALKKSLKRQEEEENFAEDLQWQQNLVEKGLDYWGRPIPDGDPRGTARLMAQNTLENWKPQGFHRRKLQIKLVDERETERVHLTCLTMKRQKMKNQCLLWGVCTQCMPIQTKKCG